MSSTLSTAKLKQKLQKLSITTVSQNTTAKVIISMAIAASTLSTIGCTTMQEFRPTASVIVGAHKSL